MPDDNVEIHNAATQGRLQDCMVAYHAGNIQLAMDHLDAAFQQLGALRYALFNTMHKSGERG